jgi:hypothetical protein
MVRGELFEGCPGTRGRGGPGTGLEFTEDEGLAQANGRRSDAVMSH